MDILIAKRGRLKGMLTRIVNFVEGLTDQHTIESVRIRLEKLDECWTEFLSIQDQFYQHLAAEDYVDPEKETEQFEIKYFNAKEALQKALHESESPLSVNGDAIKRLADQQASFLERFSAGHSTLHENYSETKLPQIRIPCFSGDYKEWISFRDLFVSSVHDNTHLTATQKFHYLKGFLKDEAAALLRHIPISEANYKQAWERLNKRYNKKDHIVKAYIRNFLSLPSTSQASASGLRRISDGADEIIRGLTALGPEAQKRDPWLIYLLLNKVDIETRQAWAENVTDIEYPSIDLLLEFLEKRCIALEDSQSSTNYSQRLRSKSSVRSLHTASATNCPKCQAEHFLFQCSEFKTMDISARREFVKNKSLCFNCLRGGHTSASCKSKQLCQKCRKHHHTLVHPMQRENSTSSNSAGSSNVGEQVTQMSQNERRPTSVNSNPNSIYNNQILRASQPSSIINNHSVQKRTSRPHSLLPTALVFARDIHGNFCTCRVLLDTGSQASLVTEAFANRLGIKRHTARISVSGLSSTGAGITRGMISLELFSRYNNQSLPVDAFILPKLTSLLPNSYFNISDWEYISNLQLADPAFNEPGVIDLILGADKVFYILENARIQGAPGSPIAQKTLFGWVLAGELPAPAQQSTSVYQSSLVSFASEIDIDKTLRRFWELETIQWEQGQDLTIDEKIAEEHFSNTTTRSPDGRYIVQLPFKQPMPKIGNTLDIALRRLFAMERKFKLDENLRNGYISFMKEYKRLGHMEEVTQEDLLQCENIFYLPHHAVHKPDSSTTKLRVVFDGSCKPAEGIALNDALLIGPPILRDLFSIVLKFRQHNYVFSADIEKMYK